MFIRAPLFESASVSATGTGSLVATFPLGIEYALFELDITAAATGGSDTLNVYVQAQVKSGHWVDIVAFTQALGNGGTKRYFAKIYNGNAESMFENGTALTAGNIRNLFSDAYRCRYTIGASGVFTFSLTMQAMVDGD